MDALPETAFAESDSQASMAGSKSRTICIEDLLTVLANGLDFLMEIYVAQLISNEKDVRGSW